ncbi:L,D-transpeptidase family protein [Rhizobium rhizogenes]|uniref:L,D-transpeptidase family protein n=1 Tax=Rhizobium rhizogenes TaxID=359 RepID=UPI0015716972|nr:L,D-transpeptidase family protein [Rhizobium rhizogenes]NTG45242.1 L,D-transpeptidase family protein [Rhizobium rhizogenes]
MSGLVNSVLNKKRKVKFGTLILDGWFSAAPDDISVNRAIRTNNPGALNISGWQRSRPGYVGVTDADANGNVTTIYQSPEHGISAWYYLISEIYQYGDTGQFDLKSLARSYAGGNAPESAVKAYTDGWSRWSNGTLDENSVVHFSVEQELLPFAKVLFAHEAGALSPIQDSQIIHGIRIEKLSLAPAASRSLQPRSFDELMILVEQARREGRLIQAYEGGLEPDILAFGAAILNNISEYSVKEWLRLYAPISDMALEGPADVTFEIYEKDRDTFIGALDALSAEELFAVQDFVAGLMDEPLTFPQLERATEIALHRSSEIENFAIRLPVLAKFTIDQENTESDVVRYTGYLQVYDVKGDQVGSYRATTGGFIASYRRKNGPTPPGYYLVSNYRRRTESWCTLHGVAFTFDIDELIHTGSRSAFRIHPDGPPPGTHGCVGLTEDAEGLRDCVRNLRANLAELQEFRLLVEYRR